MKRVLQVLCVMAMVLAVAAPAKAQFGIYGGVVLPVGDFGGNDATKDGQGLALMGYGGGIEYNVKLVTIPLEIGWVTSLSIAYNDLDNKILKQQFGNSFDYTPWLAGWPVTGIRATLPVFPVYAQVQVGGCIGKMPDVKIKGAGAELSSDPAAVLGISAGAGIELGPLTIFARYLTGEPEYEVTQKISNQSYKYKVKQKMDMLMVTAGLEF